jgi:hypothetical protein
METQELMDANEILNRAYAVMKYIEAMDVQFSEAMGILSVASAITAKMGEVPREIYVEGMAHDYDGVPNILDAEEVMQ